MIPRTNDSLDQCTFFNSRMKCIPGLYKKFRVMNSRFQCYYSTLTPTYLVVSCAFGLVRNDCLPNQLPTFLFGHLLETPIVFANIWWGERHWRGLAERDDTVPTESRSAARLSSSATYTADSVYAHDRFSIRVHFSRRYVYSGAAVYAIYYALLSWVLGNWVVGAKRRLGNSVA